MNVVMLCRGSGLANELPGTAIFEAVTRSWQLEMRTGRNGSGSGKSVISAIASITNVSQANLIRLEIAAACLAVRPRRSVQSKP